MMDTLEVVGNLNEALKWYIPVHSIVYLSDISDIANCNFLSMIIMDIHNYNFSPLAYHIKGLLTLVCVRDYLSISIQ